MTASLKGLWAATLAVLAGIGVVMWKLLSLRSAAEASRRLTESVHAPVVRRAEAQLEVLRVEKREEEVEAETLRKELVVSTNALEKSYISTGLTNGEIAARFRNIRRP